MHRSPASRPGLPIAAGGAALALALAGCSSADGATGDRSGGAVADARTATVTITAAGGCRTDRTQLRAGGITFRVTNKDATAVSEVEVLAGQRIVGEKENLPPGLSGQFAVTLAAGEYTLYCPGARTERTTLVVTGEAAAGDADVAALLKQATDGYAAYVRTQVGYLLQTSRTLATTLQGSDLAAAQQAYAAARPFYEKIEPVAESFTVGSDSLDADIDARDGDVPAAQWTGFHRIEKGLFADRSLAGLAPYGAGLVSNVQKLQQLTTTLTFQATELANGAQELLDEVAASKITGEEERYSHLDVLDFANNIEGSEQAFAQLQPALNKIDAALAGQIQAGFAALDTLVEKYRSSSDTSGYVRYTALTDQDKRELAAAVKAVQEPLSKVASKVANA
jgi:iron uptake system component EfeO